MVINIITLFPQILEPILASSILGRAQEKGLVKINLINLRDYGEGTHKIVDDRPYGGGAGMLLKAGPLEDALKSIENYQNQSVILTSARGVKFDQKMARSWSTLGEITIICGHYEGVDERFIEKFVTQEISIGDFVMTGGEIAALAMVDSVVRLLPGVLKKEEATREESHEEWNVSDIAKLLPNHPKVIKWQKAEIKTVRLLEYPHYTRPEMWGELSVPKVLMGGDHKAIAKWRLERMLEDS